ncbi:MAG: hypothetical protein AB8F78_14105 [Saprospiraceae bacterium]
MSQSLHSVLLRYNHDLTNEPLGIQIKGIPPKKSSQRIGYVLASIVGVFGLLLTFVNMTRIGFGLFMLGLIIAANVWNRGQNTNVRKAFTVLIGAEKVTLFHGFRSHSIPRDEVIDISIRQRSSDGQQEAQLYFKDATGRQHESLKFYGISGQGLKESTERIADHIWNFVKADASEHRELTDLDFPSPSAEGERAPWG